MMKTIEANIAGETIIKNSRFVTYLYRINENSDVSLLIDLIKEQHKNANHYCYAYIINDVKKFSDDGEPGGTAGNPILQVLEKNDLNFVLAVVVRYFGGIKLGVGGLVRAYTKSVTNVLNHCSLVQLLDGYSLTIEFDYDYLKKVDYLLKDINVKLDASNLNNLLNGKSISVNIDGKMENLTKKQMIDTITETENSYQRAIWNQAAYDNVISNSTDYVQAKELMEDARKEYADLQYKFSSATTTEAQEQIQEAMQAVYSKLGQYKKDMKDLESARINAVLNSGNGTFDVEYETDGTIKSGILNLAEGKKVDDVDRTAVQFGNKWCTTSGVYEINKDGKWEFKTKDMTMYFDAIKKALEDKKAKQFDDAVQREENKFKEAEKNAKGSDNK